MDIGFGSSRTFLFWLLLPLDGMPVLDCGRPLTSILLAGGLRWIQLGVRVPTGVGNFPFFWLGLVRKIVRTYGSYG